MTELGVALVRGLVDTDGTRHRDAVLVAPDGWLEAAIRDAVDPVSGMVPPATRHAVLADCLERIGGYREPDADLVAALSRGDADQLALGLRRAVLGSPLSLVLRCPNPVCREEADVDLSVEDLLADTSEPEPEWLVARADDGTEVAVRPPTGADDVAIAGVTGTPRERTAALMARLVRGLGTADDWLTLPSAHRNAALLALADAPAGPVTDLQVVCPSCGAGMEVRVDPLVLLARELRAGGDRLLVEAHCLAFHYGWSEETILALPRERRWGYLALLRAQLTGAPLESAVGVG